MKVAWRVFVEAGVPDPSSAMRRIASFSCAIAGKREPTSAAIDTINKGRRKGIGIAREALSNESYAGADKRSMTARAAG